VEALLHNLFEYKYVLHVHPTLINGLTCGVNGESMKNDLLGDDVMWIPICKPGYTLARICYEKMNEYKASKGYGLKVMLLQNHGIFVSADTLDEIDSLFSDVYNKLSAVITRTADLDYTVSDDKKSLAASLSDSLGHKVYPVPIAEADNFCKDIDSAKPLLNPFTPDHIVYCGAYPLYIKDVNNAKSDLDMFIKEKETFPRLLLVEGKGTFIMEDDESKAEKAQLLAKDAIKLAVYSESFGGPLTMTDDLIYFITHWEAESYRSRK